MTPVTTVLWLDEGWIIPRNTRYVGVYLKSAPHHIHSVIIAQLGLRLPFSALTLLVGRQEGHLACKKRLAVGLSVVMIWLELCMTYSSSCHRQFRSYLTLRMPLSPHLLANWLHYHQLHEGVSIYWSANCVRGHDSTMWIIVCRSPHWHMSEDVRHHFCRLASHNPVFVWKQFSNDHVWWGNSKPGCRTVGSDTTSIILWFNKHQLTQVHQENGH